MRRRTFVLSGLAPLALSACGGGDDPSAATEVTSDSPDAEALSGTEAQALGASDASRAFRLLPPVDGTDSAALDINRAGVVVGFTSAGEAGDFGATVWRRGEGVRLPNLGGFGSGQAGGIDDAGRVVGHSTLSLAASHATLWVDGLPIDLGTVGDAVASQARALNRAGSIVGWSYLSSAVVAPAHAILWQRGETIDLGTLGGNYSDAYDINGAGVIVGTSTVGLTGGTHATVWRHRTASRLADLGGTHSYANAINDGGTVVGSSELPAADAGTRAVLWRHGAPVALGTLGGTWAAAVDINAAGLVVGASTLADNTTSHAALWVARRAIDLNRFLDAPTREAGWYLGEATAIDDLGRVVGSAYNTLSGARRGFVLSLLARH